MNKKIITIAVIFVILILITVASSYAYVRGKIDRPLDAKSTQTVSFEIEQGQSVDEIAQELEEGRLITGSDFFKIYLWQSKLGKNLRAGNYELSPSMTIAEMVDLFNEGEGGLKSHETRAVVTEGSTNDDILIELKKSGAVTGNETFEDMIFDASEYDFLADKPEAADLQGYLFPDTYNFYKGSTLEDATAKMLDNFDQKLTSELRQAIKSQDKSVYEILIMASIVEKESPDKVDMPTIAGIFYNRLDINMALQSDATINYITKGGRPSPTSEDLEADSPYNTYKNTGLPPTPICNPGIEAIKAAIYPLETEYFYFLMPQDGSGQTIYSKTYDEHLANKAKYLK